MYSRILGDLVHSEAFLGSHGEYHIEVMVLIFKQLVFMDDVCQRAFLYTKTTITVELWLTEQADSTL